MDFKKDLLLIDLETTGLDSSKFEIVQLAAVLLDRKTLKEKKAFSTYIRPAKWRLRNKESMEVNHITWEQVKGAPSLKQVIADFEKVFKPERTIFCHYGGPVDPDFMRAAYKKVKKPFPFDYHYFNLWGLFFAYLGSKDKLKNSKRFTGFTMEDLMETYNIKSQNRHDALEDCRIEAEILRRVIKEIKN